jgi:hypothetical protein
MDSDGAILRELLAILSEIIKLTDKQFVFEGGSTPVRMNTCTKIWKLEVGGW